MGSIINGNRKRYYQIPVCFVEIGFGNKIGTGKRRLKPFSIADLNAAAFIIASSVCSGYI